MSDPLRPTHATQRVSLIPIDHLAIDDLSLLQLDVEGYERHVIEGALETIARNEPVIVLEDARDDCAELLSSLGYTRSGRVVATTSTSRLRGGRPCRSERSGEARAERRTPAGWTAARGVGVVLSTA